MIKALLCSVGLLCTYTYVSAQHSLQLDADGGKIAQLVASSSLPVGLTTFTFDNGTGIVITSNNIPSYAWLLGGNTTPPSNQLGTLSNTDLTIVTGSGGPNTRMTILAGGNVGVGDATPAALFTVGAGDAFQVGTNGNVDVIRGVTGYSWPAAHASGFLANNGSGGLSWSTTVAADRSNFGNWYEQNVGSGTVNQIVDVAGASGGGITELSIPFAGSVTGIAVTLENDASAGSILTCEVLINGTPTGLIATITGTAGANDKYGFIGQAPNLDTFVAGDRIQVRFSTNAGYGANGDAYFTVYGNL